MELASALTVTDSVAQEETPAPAVEKSVAEEKPAPVHAANSRTARPAARPAAPKPAHNTSASQRPINSEGTQGPSKEPTRTTPVAQPAPARTTPARPAQEPNRPTKVEDF